MAAIPDTVNIDCPRCDTAVPCTLRAELDTPRPGQKRSAAKLTLTVPDLANRLADHYREEHPNLLEVTLESTTTRDRDEARRAQGRALQVIGSGLAAGAHDA